jgi:ribonucleotide monophosphatase NagD (HAD superfamily)
MVRDCMETDIRMGMATSMAICFMPTGDAVHETLVASGLQPTLILEPIDGLLERTCGHNDYGHEKEAL